MLEVVLATIAAAGSVLTAWVGAVALSTRRAVNGRVDELAKRVELLEELLRWMREPGSLMKGSSDER